MDVLSIINPGKRSVDVVTPVKSMSRDDDQFGRVLNQRQQAQQQSEAIPMDEPLESVVVPENQQLDTQSQVTERGQQLVGQEEVLAETVLSDSIGSEATSAIQIELQHTLVNLMKAMVQDEAVVGTEEPRNVEMLLTDLVQQLESTDHHGEQILAGVDLSVLAAELQSLHESPDSKELLVKLVAQVEEQLTNAPELLENVDPAVSTAETPQPGVAPAVVETLVQVRQLLQQVMDAVVTKRSVEAAVVEDSAAAEPLSEETLIAMEKIAGELNPRFSGLLNPRSEDRFAQQLQLTKEPLQFNQANQEIAPVLPEEMVEQMESSKVDPRFAGLLNPRSENRLTQSVQQTKEPVQLNQSTQEFAPVLPEETLEQTQSRKVDSLLGVTARQAMENLAQLEQRSLQPQGQASVQNVSVNQGVPQSPMVQLASGQQVPESQIFDQVVTHLSGSVTGESGRMVLRLQPAELGSLRLELMVEGDRIQARLHAQSHQVQEVLERNLPQLRNALAEQGLKIDQFQVNIDQRQHSGQFENLAQQQQHNGSEDPNWQQQDMEPEELVIPLAHLTENGGGGISLHV